MNITEKIKQLYKYTEEKRIPQSALKAVPFVGDSLEELIYGGDVEEILEIVSKQTLDKQNIILEKIDYIINEEKNKKPLIFAIGGGNSEDILKLDSETILEIGDKHKVETQELFGGSGVNHSMRLLSTGYDVFPILTIGQDSIGKNIRKSLLKTARLNKVTNRVVNFIGKKDDNSFYDPNIKTPTTTIIVEHSRRTIFTQKMKNGHNFINYVQKRIAFAEDITYITPNAVMIGHIHSDSKEISKENSGSVTKFIINKFKNRSIVFTNLGSAQLSLGFEFWRNYLHDIDFFQVNLGEAKAFFRGKNGEELKLTEIIKIIKEININVVVTLDKFGAIGIHKEEKDSVYIAWPVLDSNEVIDPTGAGDAFASGLVAHLVNSPNTGANSFRDAISKARIWAAYACSTFGGANQCPTTKQLEEYQEKMALRSSKTVEIRNQDFTSEILTLLDIAFQ